jgi:Mor family transcriptional regulator
MILKPIQPGPKIGSELVFWVDLRGQFSNREMRKQVDLVEAVFAFRCESGTQVHAALSGPRSLSIRARINADEVVKRFHDGWMIKELARGYGISESSVKRLLPNMGMRKHR